MTQGGRRTVGDCPACGAGVQRASLDYSQNTQETECPRGHRVSRTWNGPENYDYTREQSYGWTSWKEVAR